jgi:hypothetical protein
MNPEEIEEDILALEREIGPTGHKANCIHYACQCENCLAAERSKREPELLILKARPITETRITPALIAHRTLFNCEQIADQIYERYCGPAPRTPTAEEKRIALLTGLLNWRKNPAESAHTNTPDKDT